MQAVDGHGPENHEIEAQQESLGRAEVDRDQGHGSLSAEVSASGWFVLLGWWAGLLGCVILLAHLGNLRANARQAVIILMIGGTVYAGACTWLHLRWKGWSSISRRRVIVAVCAGALILRLLLLAVPPSLSDDVFRFRWDGKVQAQGLNPYTEPPASTYLAELRDPQWEQINYPTIRTIYPPLAQALFTLTYLVHDGLIAYQILALLGDLVVIALLLSCLLIWRLPAWLVTIYAWSPLAMVESASSAHYDSWVIAAVMLAVYALLTERPTLSTAALAAGILLKTWPLIFVPLFLRKRPWWHGVLLAALVAAAYMPYLGAGLGLLHAWMEFSSRWLFNDAAFAILRTVTGSLAMAKGVTVVILLGLLQLLWRREVDPVRGSYWLLVTTILLTPAIQPWYLLWALPLAAAAMDVAWILLTILVPLAYWILVGAVADSNLWVEPTWVRFVVYLPALAVWLVQTAGAGPAAPPVTPDRSLVGSFGPVP
jgi:hypothetical protein